MAEDIYSNVMPSKDEIDQYKNLSRDLYARMEKVGCTSEVRDTKTEMARIHEILLTLMSPLNVSEYIFGSIYEGYSPTHETRH